MVTKLFDYQQINEHIISTILADPTEDVAITAPFHLSADGFHIYELSE